MKTTRRRCAERLNSRRRGLALLALVLILTLVTSTLAVTLMSTIRLERRIQSNLSSAAEADILARSALELAFRRMTVSDNWRKEFTSGQVNRWSYGDRSLWFVLTDEDGDLSDSELDPVEIEAASQASGAERHITADLTPAPHTALKFAAVGDDLFFQSNIRLNAIVRANDDISAADHVTVGLDGGFETVDSGTVTSDLEPLVRVEDTLGIPAPDLDRYTKRCTSLSPGWSDPIILEGRFLNGNYVLEAGTRSVHIRNVRLRGTLVIRGSGSNPVAIVGPCDFESAAPDQPTLLVDRPNGVLVVLMDGDKLQERFASGAYDSGDWDRYQMSGVVDFYYNEERNGNSVDLNGDGDTGDSYDPSISGLIWTSTPHTVFSGPWSFTGCIIGEDIHFDDRVSIAAQEGLDAQLIEGFLAPLPKLVVNSIRPAE